MPSSIERTSPIPDKLLDELDATAIMLGRLMVAQHERVYPSPGLTGPRLLMLRVLSELGDNKARELASLLGIKASATSSLIDSLERAGLVTRTPGVDDRRVTIVSITDEGAKELELVEASRRERMRDLLSVLTDEDIATIIRIQRSLIVAMVDTDR